MGTVCCQSQVNEDVKKQLEILHSNSGISPKTKKIIALAHLLACLIHDFFESDEQRCPYVDDQANGFLIADICSNIFLEGGAVRDIILKKPVNDLDLTANTQELTKIQRDHLLKYHSTVDQQKDTRCALWKLYLMVQSVFADTF